MTKNSFDHTLDLAAEGVLELFAEEVSSAEQLQMCCDQTYGCLACAFCGGTCASSFSCASSESCGCTC